MQKAFWKTYCVHQRFEFSLKGLLTWLVTNLSGKSDSQRLSVCGWKRSPYFSSLLLSWTSYVTRNMLEKRRYRSHFYWDLGREQRCESDVSLFIWKVIWNFVYCPFNSHVKWNTLYLLRTLSRTEFSPDYELSCETSIPVHSRRFSYTQHTQHFSSTYKWSFLLFLHF